MTNDATLVENLKYLVGLAESDHTKAEEELRAQRERLDRARALLESEQQRLGTRNGSGRFVGATLRDSVLQVLKEDAPNTLHAQAIWDRIQKEGCVVPDTKWPGRAIHAALLNVEGVVREGKGKFHWENGASPQRPEEEGTGNAEQG